MGKLRLLGSMLVRSYGSRGSPHNVYDMESSEPAPILDRSLPLCARGVRIMLLSVRILSPYVPSMVCADHGWSRGDVASYLFQKAVVNVGEVREASELRAWEPWQHALRAGSIPMTSHLAT